MLIILAFTQTEQYETWVIEYVCVNVSRIVLLLFHLCTHYTVNIEEITVAKYRIQNELFYYIRSELVMTLCSVCRW